MAVLRWLGSATLAEQVLDCLRLAVRQERERLDQLLADVAEVAGIAKTDAQGRTVDIHCLRRTFATMLSQAGVARVWSKSFFGIATFG